MTKDQREIQRKLRIFRNAEETGHVAKTGYNVNFIVSSYEQVTYLRLVSPYRASQKPYHRFLIFRKTSNLRA